MSLDSLCQFIEALDAAGELARVRHPVSVDLELCEIADRVMKSPGGGKALLFEHVTLFDGSRSAYPVAINLFGSMRRMAMALGVEDLDEIGRRIGELLEMKVPEGLIAKLALLPRLPLVRTAYHAYFRFVLPVVGRLVSGHPTAYRYLPESVARFPTEEALGQRMAAAGMSEVRWRRLTLGIAAIHVGVR